MTGRGAAVPGDDEVALDAARIEVAVEPGHEEDGIDVRRDDLFFGGIAGGAAGKAARPRQDGADPRVGAVGWRLDGDPVTHGRKVHPLRGLMAQSSGDARQPFTRFGEHAIDVRVLERDARRDQTLGGMRGESVRQRGRPAERREVNRHV